MTVTTKDDNDPVEYISTGCNRSPHCMAWSHVTGHVYYGSNNSVSVYSVQQYRVLTTLVGHTARVNCVRLVTCDDNTEYLVTCSTDHSVTVWKCDQTTWTRVSTNKLHTGPVTNVSAVIQDNLLLIASTSNDNTIKLHKFHLDGSDKVDNVGNINLGTGTTFNVICNKI